MFHSEMNLLLLNYQRMSLTHFPNLQLLVSNLGLQIHNQCSPSSYVLLENLCFFKKILAIGC